MTIVLEAKNVNKSYSVGRNNEQSVLKNVNLQLQAGEFVSIMGPSGCGKSTLLYTISGMDKMTSGSVAIQGQEIGSLSEERLAQLRLSKMGFIFQQSGFLKNLSLLDNMILPAYMAKRESRAVIDRRASELMQRTGIAGLANADKAEVSGGQLQRAAICRALINQPDIVFGDEPTGALNSKASDEVMAILTELNHTGTTIMLVTHDAKVAAKTQRVLFMLDGRIVGERVLGQLGQAELKVREAKLSSWLAEMGF
ncbi:putative ABC transport system ATP-binding protein [Paenibacillus algorifonticola]|uniref:Putative ABC transport system ATP-binding protein n=1 Tax=Paenibacillus algorifonticola TaxID=684063 RepID=A0A1I2EFG9_9BACL|nr:ABC transporter ATP-binding protein [Paenibacillus algorifonticola]SFE91000.1 putative ABC transport system ATP-binding protein [Paenibacillus algorifonticola]